MTDILPCPFCGSQAALSVLEDDPGEIISAWVHCSCGIEIHERRTEEEAIKWWNRRAAPAQGAMVPAAWQYRVMFDARHERRDEWCPWRDAGEKYFNKVNAEIAAGATRVQTRILYALPSTMPSTTENKGE